MLLFRKLSRKISLAVLFCHQYNSVIKIWIHVFSLSLFGEIVSKQFLRTQWFLRKCSIQSCDSCPKHSIISANHKIKSKLENYFRLALKVCSAATYKRRIVLVAIPVLSYNLFLPIPYCEKTQLSA